MVNCRVKCLRIVYLYGLALLLFSAYTQAQVQIIMGKSTLEMGEQIQMVIHSSQSSTLDESSLYDALTPFFQIGGIASNQQIQLINGKRIEKYTWTVLLTATQVGSHRITGIKVGQQTHQPIDVLIKAIQSSTSVAGQKADFIMLGEVDQSEPYVKSEVIYTLKILFSHNILGGQLSRLVVANWPIKTIGKEKRYNTVYQGKQYNVVEWRFVFIPEVSGKIIIPQVTFSGVAQMPQGRQNIRLATEVIDLKVKSQPSEWQVVMADWLPAKSMNIWEKWQPSVSVWMVGQRYRRDIQLDAMGIEAKQIADIRIDTQANSYSVYPQSPIRNESLEPTGHLAKYQIQVDYVANETGLIQLPEIKVPWWDVEKNQLRFAILPARQIQVIPNGNSNDVIAATSILSTPNDTQKQSSNSLSVLNLQTLDKPPLETRQDDGVEGISLLELFSDGSASTKMILLIFLLLYTVILTFIGYWMGRGRSESNRFQRTFLQQEPISLTQAIADLNLMVKNRKNRKADILYQMMLRCYNKYGNRFSLALTQKWLQQIEQLRVKSQDNEATFSKIDVNKMKSLFEDTLSQQREQEKSPLPNLYKQV